MNKQELKAKGFEAYQGIHIAQQKIREFEQIILQVNHELQKLKKND